MKTALYVLLVLSFWFLLFRLPVMYAKKKLLLILGLGMAVSFVLMIVGYFCFLLYASKTDAGFLMYERQFVSLFMGIFSLFFYGFFILLFTEVIFENVLIGFHKKYNRENLDKNPVKFAVNNAGKIKKAYKIMFFLGGFLVYYGIVFGA